VVRLLKSMRRTVLAATMAMIPVVSRLCIAQAAPTVAPELRGHGACSSRQVSKQTPVDAELSHARSQRVRIDVEALCRSEWSFDAPVAGAQCGFYVLPNSIVQRQMPARRGRLPPRTS